MLSPSLSVMNNFATNCSSCTRLGGHMFSFLSLRCQAMESLQRSVPKRRPQCHTWAPGEQAAVKSSPSEPVHSDRRARVLSHCSRVHLCDPVDLSLPGSSVHGILQARTLEWVAIPFSRGSSQPWARTQISLTEDRFFTVWATREQGEIKGIRILLLRPPCLE